jgi:hypothetical protein
MVMIIIITLCLLVGHMPTAYADGNAGGVVTLDNPDGTENFVTGTLQARVEATGVGVATNIT